MNKEFWKYSINRAIRTMAQTAIASISGSALLSEINWPVVASASCVAGILSILTSLTVGIPELEEKER